MIIHLQSISDVLQGDSSVQLVSSKVQDEPNFQDLGSVDRRRSRATVGIRYIFLSGQTNGQVLP